MFRRVSVSLFFFGSVTLAAACSSETESSNGNSVGTARSQLSWDDSCQLMDGWTRFSTLDCQTCVAGSKLGCECAKEKPWNGVCQSQAEARRAEPDCNDQLFQCLGTCKECACKRNCIAGHDACKAKDAPLASCIAQTCETYCK